MQKVRQQGNWLKVCEEQLGDKASDLQPSRPMAWDIPSQEVTECFRASRMCETPGSLDPTDLASFGEEEDDESVILKKYFSWWEPDHSENEYGNFPTDPGEECVQHRAGQCAGVNEGNEASTAKLYGGKGKGVLSPALEQDACLHEDDSDQSMYMCSSPTNGGGDDLENSAASSSLQVWFDMEALGAHVCDNLDAIVTTVQLLRTAFREPSPMFSIFHPTCRPGYDHTHANLTHNMHIVFLYRWIFGSSNVRIKLFRKIDVWWASHTRLEHWLLTSLVRGEEVVLGCSGFSSVDITKRTRLCLLMCKCSRALRFCLPLCIMFLRPRSIVPSCFQCSAFLLHRTREITSARE